MIQDAIFGSALTLQPLVNSDKIWIEAGYPVDMKSQIEPILTKKRSQIAEMAKSLDFSSAIAIQDLKEEDIVKRNEFIDRIAQTFGRFTGGFISGVRF